MAAKLDEILFKKDECWKESEKRFLETEWRNSKESLESLLSSNTANDQAFSINSNLSQENRFDEFSVAIDDDFSSSEELFYQFSNFSTINRVFCDISSVKYTIYSEVRHIFYFLSFFFFLLFLILVERSWNGVIRIKVDYESYGKFPLLFKAVNDSSEIPDFQKDVTYENNTLFEFTIDRTLQEPVYIYFGINGFYSNTKEFIGSKPPEIFGYGYKCTHILSIEDILKYRPDFRRYLADFFRVPYNFNFGVIDRLFSKGKKSRIFKIGKRNNFINRNILCGLPVYSVFTDEFELLRKNSLKEKIQINTIDFPEDQWKYKILHNFRQFVSGVIEKSIFPVNESVKGSINDKIPRLSIVLSRWWNHSISPNFIKPYGVISSSYEYNGIDDTVLYPGSYEFNVTSNIFPNNAWGAEKYILLMNLSVFGGEQYFAAAFCLLISIIYAFIIYFNPNRAQIIIIKNKINQEH
ncbi:putative LEM3/CDC50 family protein [Cryptosporidium felis]|nr:putative LEM3/CDC50 family protein [Cryptosporidium felis]